MGYIYDSDEKVEFIDNKYSKEVRLLLDCGAKIEIMPNRKGFLRKGLDTVHSENGKIAYIDYETIMENNWLQSLINTNIYDDNCDTIFKDSKCNIVKSNVMKDVVIIPNMITQNIILTTNILELSHNSIMTDRNSITTDHNSNENSDIINSDKSMEESDIFHMDI